MHPGFTCSIGIIFLLLAFNEILYAQTATIRGHVTDLQGEAMPGITVLLDKNIGVATDVTGNFTITKVTPGAHTLTVSGIGYQSQALSVILSAGQTKQLSIQLEEATTRMDEIKVVGKSEVTEIEERGFNVEAVATRPLQSQSLDLNQVLDRTAGVRIRQSGGMGSDFNYSLDGMSGNAVRFFVDGIPLDYFGSSFTINNFPMLLVERVDVYKGVVPVELGSDALGGAINITTRKEQADFADVSYSYGSFNTHQVAIQGQWAHDRSGFTTRLSSFYNYSDNNYKVWGPSVTWADASTGYRAVEFTKDNPAERFNDDFQTINAKLDVGFTDVDWADQFFISLLASGQQRGIQTAQTMARVFGNVRYDEQFLMPSMVYQKKDLFTKGLNVDVFAGYSITEGTLADTSLIQYGWKADSIGYRVTGGEMGYDGKSLFTLNDKSWIGRVNATYKLRDNLTLGINYIGSQTTRTGEDPFTPEYRIPYLKPQGISSQFGGLSLESRNFDDRLYTNAFVKLYNFSSSINELDYIDNESVAVEYKNSETNWGAGFATSYKIFPNLLAKLSLEQATRMPTAKEALGDGVTIDNNPTIKPEQSLNINLGTILGRYSLGDHHGMKVAVNTFYRDTKNQLLFTVTDGLGNGEFRNINKTLGKGVELDIIYDYKQWMKITANATYLDIRNNLEYEENGNRNIVYRDRLRNTPYLMANAGVELNLKDVIQQGSKLLLYLQSGYVHEFYLRWPSLGDKSEKSVIPSQLVLDAGAGYTFPSGRFSVAADISNLLNEQVYDNFLLQKPGRAVFLKVRYQIKSNN